MPGRLAQASPALTSPANANPLGAPTISGVFALDVPDGVTANLDWSGLAGVSFRVLDVWVVKTTGNDTAAPGADTIQLQTLAGAAISNAIDIGGIADQTVVRAGTIDDATHVIAAGGGLRVRRTRPGATQAACIVYVEIAEL